MKLHATDRMRAAITDTMDVHGGKAIMDGPNNYLGNVYRSIPVGITVEGANILTRNLIVFGQGAIRAHPYLLEEINALGDPDKERALDRFDKAFWSHVTHSFATFARAFVRSWSGGLISPAPDAGPATRFYRQLSRYAAGFALTSDIALLVLGGSLKRKEMLSARLGDILSELYLLSGALKRWEDEGRQEADFPLLEWCLEKGFATIQLRFAEVFANFPNRPISWLLHAVIQPLGAYHHGPRDEVSQRCAQILLEPSEARDRLTAGIFHKDDDSGLARLERAFKLVTDAESIAKKLRDAKINDWHVAKDNGIISHIEDEQLRVMHEAVSKVIEVDDFAPEALSPIYRKPIDDNSQASRARRSAMG
jgi:acyl-CoA dehydrogenase